VEAIDVLRDDAAEEALVLEPREGRVRGVRLRAAEADPPHHRAGPVAGARVGRAQEVAVLDRSARPMPRRRAAVVWDAAVRAQPRARQGRDRPSREQLDDRVEVLGTPSVERG
jgi:hypothetical protein